LFIKKPGSTKWVGFSKAKKSEPGKEFSTKDRKHKKLTLGLEKKDISQYKPGNMP
jgi:hypothetical protein